MIPSRTIGSGDARVSVANALIPGRSVGARAMWRSGGFAIAGSLFIAMCAQVSVPMLPVPVTMQTFGVLLVAMALGWKGGAAAVGLYLLEGAAGLPVFAGGVGGAARLVGPTAGYLGGFLIAAVAAGWLSDQGWGRRFTTALGAMLLGDAVILLCGATWLALETGAAGGDPVAAFAAGFAPFVVGAVVKSVAAAALLRPTRRLARGR